MNFNIRIHYCFIWFASDLTFGSTTGIGKPFSQNSNLIFFSGKAAGFPNYYLDKGLDSVVVSVTNHSTTGEFILKRIECL